MIWEPPNLGRDLDIQVHKINQSKFQPQTVSTRYIVIKLSNSKDREEVFKSREEKKYSNIKGNIHMVTRGFSVEIFQARTEWGDVEWGDVFKCWKKKKNPQNNNQLTKDTLPNEVVSELSKR